MSERSLLRQGFAECGRVTQHHAKSFYLASHALDPLRRDAAYAVYAFCRRIDDSIDEAEGASNDELLRRVRELRETLDLVCSFATLQDPKLRALRATIRTFGLQRKHFDELIDGVAWDVTLTQIADEPELLHYCYLVAGTVGLMMAQLFGVQSPQALEHAKDLGIAMQITNIMRDIREDYVTRGRVYLPLTLLQQFGVEREQLKSESTPQQLRLLCQVLGNEAEARYRSADLGVPMITSVTGRVATAMMRASYSEILRRLRAQDYPVLAGRMRVSTLGKLQAISRYALRTHP